MCFVGNIEPYIKNRPKGYTLNLLLPLVLTGVWALHEHQHVCMKTSIYICICVYSSMCPDEALMSIAYCFLPHSGFSQTTSKTWRFSPSTRHPQHVQAHQQTHNELWVRCPNRCRDTAGCGKWHERKQTGLEKQQKTRTVFFRKFICNE